MSAIYNEIEPYPAQWMRNLIAAGHIAPGVVDERSIAELDPADVAGPGQRHFFAGIGVWSYALRLAGWPDDRDVWTGSCPCQPFSAAGRGRGFADERHLWPEWFRLIRECRPAVVLGEQVASPAGLGWFDAVRADLEGAGYAVGAADLCAAGVGAPHIRQRLYFVAHLRGARLEVLGEQQARGQLEATERGGEAGELADVPQIGRRQGNAQRSRSGDRTLATDQWNRPSDDGEARHLGDAELHDRTRRPAGSHGRQEVEPDRSGATRGFWSPADWIPCRDGKVRPVEPVYVTMVDGSAESLGRMCPTVVSDITQEVRNAIGNYDSREAMLDLWCALTEEAIFRAPGRSDGVHEAPVLLAFVRQLAEQGWEIAKGVPCTSQEIQEASVRVLRGEDALARSSHRRGLDKQRPREPTDALRVLSSILARHAQAAWGEAFASRSAATFPLTRNAQSRMGRLRAYGNAICAPLAAAFIGSVMEVIP